MLQHTKRTQKTMWPRSDLATARQTEDSYIAKISPPALGNKGEWVRGAFARGVPFRDLIKGSGLKTQAVLRLCGIDPEKHIDLVSELETFRINLLNHRD